MNVSDKIQLLLDKHEESRLKLEEYELDMIKLKDSVSRIFPEKLDYRNKHVLEDSIKSCTSFFASLLNIRQQIEKNIVSRLSS
jgi:hypothetical protein